MRLLSRRTFLIGGPVAAAVGVLADKVALAQRPQAFLNATPIAVTAQPISRFSMSDPDRSRFGALYFRSGLNLKSETSAFGGFSGLWRSPKGQEIIALADNAQCLKARLETSDGRLSGLSRTIMEPLVLSSGTPLRRSRYYDTESFTLSGGAAFVGVERNHAVVRFARDRSGALVRGVPLPGPKELKDLPSNGGLEAIGVAPQRSPLAGALVGIAEGGRGFIFTGKRQGTFGIVRSNSYDVTDLGFLDNGDVLLLERRFSLIGGFGCRLRRIEAAALKPDVQVDGDIVYESEASHQIDNMEGLALHQEGDETIVTLISDNNFSSYQRTLLLEFSLAG